MSIFAYAFDRFGSGFVLTSVSLTSSLLELRTRYPGHRTHTLSLHRLFHLLEEAEASQPK